MIDALMYGKTECDLIRAASLGILDASHMTFRGIAEGTAIGSCVETGGGAGCGAAITGGATIFECRL
jgi:hypothetical protein